VSEREFEELIDDFEAGRISRRRFIGQMVAGGVGVAAAVAFASSSADAFGFFGRRRGHVYGGYGQPPGGVIYGAHRPLQSTPHRPLRIANVRKSSGPTFTQTTRSRGRRR
jgi:hypothetical protein